jgi:fatty acid-binding protein DegV
VVRYTTGMSKRLQVVIGDADLLGYERTARASGLSLSEWVRQALRVAQRESSDGDVEAKLAVIRKAASYRFPVADIDTMLAETEAGRLDEIEAGLAGADV